MLVCFKADGGIDSSMWKQVEGDSGLIAQMYGSGAGGAGGRGAGRVGEIMSEIYRLTAVSLCSN